MHKPKRPNSISRELAEEIGFSPTDILNIIDDIYDSESGIFDFSNQKLLKSLIKRAKYLIYHNDECQNVNNYPYQIENAMIGTLGELCTIIWLIKNGMINTQRQRKIINMWWDTIAVRRNGDNTGKDIKKGWTELQENIEVKTKINTQEYISICTNSNTLQKYKESTIFCVDFRGADKYSMLGFITSDMLPKHTVVRDGRIMYPINEIEPL